MHLSPTGMLFGSLCLLLIGRTTGPVEAQQAVDAPAIGTLVAAEAAALPLSASYFAPSHTYRYSASDIPADQVAEQAPERTVRFGDEVSLRFAGLDPMASYSIQLIFLSDSSNRIVSIKAGDDLLNASYSIPQWKVLRPQFTIPESDYSGGNLAVTIYKASGNNAVLSGFQLYSSSSQEVKPQPIEFPPAPPIPRYTPLPRLVHGTTTLLTDLGGVWNFASSVKSSVGPAAPTANCWKPIAVPGEWAEQGFTVPKGSAALYFRHFVVPASWSKLNIKLKCDAVYSDAMVWVNGKPAGGHLGGFTPFEIDVTKFVHPGQVNSISVSVKADSLADVVSSGMQYAAHCLGGITRKIYLFAAPATTIADAYVTTSFDHGFSHSVVNAALEVANDGSTTSSAKTIRLQICGSDGLPVNADTFEAEIPSLTPASTKAIIAKIPFSNPKLWDPDHPNLYLLRCSLSMGSVAAESVDQRFGFRQVEVRGNQLCLNGHSFKIRGVARHEIDPLRGRSLEPGEWSKDVDLFRRANVTSIRTSHYPPAKEFVEACDKLGMLVEEEAPICWADASDPDEAALFVEGMAETIIRDRSDPSVIMWSLGNETQWGQNFEQSLFLSRRLDASRLFVCEGNGDKIDEPVPAGLLFAAGELKSAGDDQPLSIPVTTPHYPSLEMPVALNKSPYPVLFGEYAHLTCYDRTEVYTDPGLRDIWGEGFSKMWENIEQSAGAAGGNIWAGIDDMLFNKDGTDAGYGSWGIIDGWRRRKPEYFYVKKVYSPVRVSLIRGTAAQMLLKVDCRSDFSKLSEYRFRWTVGGKSGWFGISSASVNSSYLRMHIAANSKGPLHIDVFGPRGFVVDDYDFPGFTRVQLDDISAQSTQPVLTYSPDKQAGIDSIDVNCGRFQWTIDKSTGMIRSGSINGHQVVSGGPYLMLLAKQGPCPTQIIAASPSYSPVNSPCPGWRLSSILQVPRDGSDIEFAVKGVYDNAAGSYTLDFGPNGGLTVTYDFAVTAPIDLWEAGLALDAVKTYDSLTWTRYSNWSGYKADDIGRTIGTAYALQGALVGDPLGPRIEATNSWSTDRSPLGSNDFRSTKWHVFAAGLRDPGGRGINLISDGSQNVRTWLEGDHVKFFVEDFANQGSASFIVERLYPDRMLKAGDHITGSAKFTLAP